jgi:hypothetical protein
MALDHKPKSFRSLDEAMKAMRADAEPSGEWVKPLEPASRDDRANEARRQAQRIRAEKQ